MEHDYWHNKWETNDIGFHESDGNPYLKKYLSVLKRQDKNRVFVPLCGKTKDIGYLLHHGCEVVAVELNETAVIQLFDELNVKPEVKNIESHKVYACPDVTVFVGDIFALTPELIGEVTAIYDRAALVALPAQMRSQYVSLLPQLTLHAPQLLLTFSYDQDAIAGPPFSISMSDVEALYNNTYSVKMLTQSSVPGGLKGLVHADCLVFELK
jgi:thiopurine S-methyltransferase